MKTQKIMAAIMSIMLFFAMSFSFAQQNNEDVQKLYDDYKKNGIEKAINNYKKSPLYKNEYTALGEPINILGYRLMEEGELDAAEKVFLVQLEEYPNQANPHDSYADLLLEKGDKEKAQKHFKKSVELAANIKDKNEKREMLAASKTKLARLDGTGSELKFMEGTWTTKNYGYQNGEKVLRNEGEVEFTTNEDNTILTGILHGKNGEMIGTRIIAYDAVEEQYDMVWVSNNAISGLDPSTLKIEKSTPDKIVMIEEFEENGEQVKIKHVLNKKNNEISWDIHDLTKGDGTEPVAHMTFNKNN